MSLRRHIINERRMESLGHVISDSPGALALTQTQLTLAPPQLSPGSNKPEFKLPKATGSVSGRGSSCLWKRLGERKTCPLLPNGLSRREKTTSSRKSTTMGSLSIPPPHFKGQPDSWHPLSRKVSIALIMNQTLVSLQESVFPLPRPRFFSHLCSASSVSAESSRSQSEERSQSLC